MLQILSTSNETATGTELVQNGNFSELGSDLILNGDFAEVGSDLVTNGDFSAAGSNLVTNPNFTDTGSELVLNWDFSSSSSHWSHQNNSTISVGTHEGRSDVADINITGTSTADRIEQSFTYVDGASYKVTVEVYVVSGSFRIDCRDTFVTTDFISTTTTGEWQTLTAYITAIQSGTDVIWLRSNSPGGISQFYVDSVSIKELGADWTELSIDPDSVSFDENGLTIVQSTDLGNENRVYQLNVTEDSKSYKVTYTIHSISLTSGNSVKYYNGAGYVELPEQGVGTHTFYYTRQGTADTWNFNLATPVTSATDFVTISSLSVQELGEGWTFFGVDATNTISIESGGARVISTGVNISLRQTILEVGKHYKLTCNTTITSGALGLDSYTAGTTTNFTEGSNVVYFTAAATLLIIKRITGADNVLIDNITVQEVGQDWTFGTGWSIGEDKAVAVSGTASKLQQTNPSLNGKSCKVTFTLSNYGGAGVLIVDFGSTSSSDIDADGTHIRYGTYDQNYFQLYKSSTFSGDVTNVIVQELDPNGYWTLGTGWSIGADKAISTVTGSNSDITQSILTAGKTYRTVYEIVDYTAGTAQAIVTGSDGSDAVALGTYTEDLTTTGTDFSIRSKLGTFDGAVSSVSVKQLGTYEDQSIYVTAADVQTIPQASVYYLVELTSMGSKNSLYFIPSSVVPNNGRYTKLNFTVISKDALPQPTVGIISFYDSVGGLDTYPMGFYEFRIYEQTSSTNLDPLLATGLLEKGFAFVRDFSGNMQELTDGFKEYNPALTQYVYSK